MVTNAYDTQTRYRQRRALATGPNADGRRRRDAALHRERVRTTETISTASGILCLYTRARCTPTFRRHTGRTKEYRRQKHYLTVSAKVAVKLITLTYFSLRVHTTVTTRALASRGQRMRARMLRRSPLSSLSRRLRSPQALQFFPPLGSRPHARVVALGIVDGPQPEQQNGVVSFSVSAWDHIRSGRIESTFLYVSPPPFCPSSSHLRCRQNKGPPAQATYYRP